jgi:hypothetical protein
MFQLSRNTPDTFPARQFLGDAEGSNISPAACEKQEMKSSLQEVCFQLKTHQGCAPSKKINLRRAKL